MRQCFTQPWTGSGYNHHLNQSINKSIMKNQFTFVPFGIMTNDNSAVNLNGTGTEWLKLTLSFKISLFLRNRIWDIILQTKYGIVIGIHKEPRIHQNAFQLKLPVAVDTCFILIEIFLLLFLYYFHVNFTWNSIRRCNLIHFLINLLQFKDWFDLDTSNSTIWMCGTFNKIHTFEAAHQQSAVE